MTCTSGEPTAATPSKMFAVGLPKRLTTWVPRPANDPQGRWSSKIAIPKPELKEWLNGINTEWETFTRREKKISSDGEEKISYRLVVRSYDQRLLALLALHWRIPEIHISSTWKTSSKGILPASQVFPKRSKTGLQTEGSNTSSIYVRNGQQKRARSRYFASQRRSCSN